MRSPRYPLGCVASRSALPRERFSPLAHREIFLQRKPGRYRGHGGHRASLTPFNLAEAAD
jgi:hypothetical protein